MKKISYKRRVYESVVSLKPTKKELMQQTVSEKRDLGVAISYS